MLRVLTIISILSLVGCMTQQTQHVQKPTVNRPAVKWSKGEATDTEITEAQRLVISKLKDPEGARFREIWALVGSNGKRSVYGYVNAKNSFGGYTGKKIFTMIKSGNVFIEGSDVIMDQLFPRICMPRNVE